MSVFFTIGHSTRDLAEFIGILDGFGVKHVADVRRFPGSRRFPQYGERLAPALADAGIGYTHFVDLGGRRTPVPDSPNRFWTNASFRGYADYAMTPPFARALDALRAIGAREACAVMCAEAVWWRCHRRIVTDYLLARGENVRHLFDAGHAEDAELTPEAVVEPSGVLMYPPTPNRDLFG